MACKLKPNLVICDILMDGVDGYGVLNMLRSDPRTAGIPLIFVTGVADRQAIQRAKQAGVNDYLVKPFTQTELLDIVGRQI